MPDPYINTDLVLKSKEDLASLASLIEGSGVETLSASTLPDGVWYAVFETEEQFGSPEETIEVLLERLDASEAPTHPLWDSCISRELDLGFERAEEQVSEFVLNSGILSRTSRLGLSLRMTLYGTVPDTNP